MQARLAFLWLSAIVIPGCVYDELLATHIMAGGVVRAQINGGTMHASTGLGDGKDPLAVNGFAADLTFGLIVGDDALSAAATPQLVNANVTVQLPITPLSKTRLQVNLEGSGCDAQNGTVNLHTDGDKLISGDFAASGTVPGGSTVCQVSGTLDKIPVDR